MASKEYQKLKEKIKKEYNDFAVSIEKLDKRTIIEKAKEIYIMQEVKMVFETENIFIPKEALAFLMNDDINAIKELTEIILDAESVPKVYKIFGPGNQYVTAAKQQVSLCDVAIDMPAGPSEVEVLADETANPVFVAADLLSQAEHGVDSQAMLVTTSEKLMEEVEYEVQRQLALLSRWEIAEKSLANSKLILVKDMDEAIALTNEYAPEHLIIETRDYEEQAERIVNAGSVFLGSLSPESAGDYASGTNHTLPTNGYAKAYGGVSLDSFIRKITFQEITREGIEIIGPAIEVMAANEQLSAHKNAVTVRLKAK